MDITPSFIEQVIQITNLRQETHHLATEALVLALSEKGVNATSIHRYYITIAGSEDSVEYLIPNENPTSAFCIDGEIFSLHYHTAPCSWADILLAEHRRIVDREEQTNYDELQYETTFTSHVSGERPLGFTSQKNEIIGIKDKILVAMDLLHGYLETNSGFETPACAKLPEQPLGKTSIECLNGPLADNIINSFRKHLEENVNFSAGIPNQEDIKCAEKLLGLLSNNQETIPTVTKQIKKVEKDGVIIEGTQFFVLIDNQEAEKFLKLQSDDEYLNVIVKEKSHIIQNNLSEKWDTEVDLTILPSSKKNKSENIVDIVNELIGDEKEFIAHYETLCLTFRTPDVNQEKVTKKAARL